MSKTYEIIFKVESSTEEEAAHLLATAGYNLTDYSDIRELKQDKNLPKYIGKTITILDTNAVAANAYIYEKPGWRGLLQSYDRSIYKIKSSATPLQINDWFICDESIDELLELGAITVT